MAKLKLTYDLPDERHAAMCALNASDAYGALYDIAQHLRTLDKHGPEHVEVAALRRAVCDLMAQAGVDSQGLAWWGE